MLPIAKDEPSAGSALRFIGKAKQGILGCYQYWKTFASSYCGPSHFLSDVIQVPISSIEQLNNDQYRSTASVNQLIYGGGAIDASLKVGSAALKTQQQQVEGNLYQLKKQINQLYFSINLSCEKQTIFTLNQPLG
jgi:hypothetical protein